MLDLEELADLGLPAMARQGKETPLLDELASMLVEYGTDADLITLVPPPKAAAQAAGVLAHRATGDPRVQGRSRRLHGQARNRKIHDPAPALRESRLTAVPVTLRPP
jgi:hypothetical protein